MKVKVSVPDSLNEIKLSQYQKFLRVTKDIEDEHTIKKRMVGVFCDIPDDIVNKMTKTSFNDILMHISNLLNIDKDKMELQRLVKYDGIKYGFIPNMDKLTVGELADVDNYIADWQQMDKAMGVLYRPLQARHNNTYLIEEYKMHVSLDFPLDVVLGAYFFLTDLVKDLLNYIPNFITEEIHQDPKLKTLVQNGVGINQFTDLLKVTFSELTKSLN